MEFDRQLRWAILAAIVTLGFLARASTFAAPLLDFHSWRQADTAAISRNFARAGLNPLEPQVDHIGPGGSSRVVTGLEAHAWIAAVIARGFPKFEPGVGRLLSTGWFSVSALLLWSLARRRYGGGAALAGTLVYAFGFPLVFFIERAFMNEALLVSLGLGALHEAQRYVHDGRTRALATLGASLTLIAVIKPTHLVVAAAVAGVFAEKHGWKALVRWELIGLALACAGSCAAWFLHAQAAAGGHGVTFGLTDKLVDWGLLFSGRYPFIVGRRLVQDILGPLGVAALVAGLVVAVRQRRRMELLGVLAFGGYLAVVVVGNAAHSYYQLTLVPVAAPTVALGLWRWIDGGSVAQGWRRSAALRLLLVGCLAVATSLVRFSGVYSWFRVDWAKRHLCDELPRVTGKDELLVFAGYNSPDLLFCADRRGWLLAPHESSPDAVSRAVSQGASVVVIARDWAAATPHATDLSLGGRTLIENRRFLVRRVR